MDNAGELKKASTAIDAIEVALAKCSGIEIDDSRVVSEDDFSMTDIRLTLRWEADAITYRSGDQETIAPSV